MNKIVIIYYFVSYFPNIFRKTVYKYTRNNGFPTLRFEDDRSRMTRRRFPLDGGNDNGAESSAKACFRITEANKSCDSAMTTEPRMTGSGGDDNTRHSA